jgi:hypothetical protein
MGAMISRVDVVRFRGSATLGALVEAIAGRVHSTTWTIRDDMLAASANDLQEWTLRECGPNYRAREFGKEALFGLDLARFQR